jgi:hypothetical protein
MRTENYYIDYRYIPGSLKDGSSLDNGAVMREARRTRRSVAKRIAELKADARIQWIKVRGHDVASPLSSYGHSQSAAVAALVERGLKEGEG